MKKTIKVIIFLNILVILIIIIGELFNPINDFEEPWRVNKATKEFFLQKKDSIDIVYVGASSVYSDISPLEIYNNIGVTGFTIGTPDQSITSSYYYINEVFKTQKPKIIFLETEEFYKGHSSDSEYHDRMDMDTIPFNFNKINMVNDNAYQLSFYDKLNAVFPIMYYHSRYYKINKKILKEINRKSETFFKGYVYINKKVKLKTITKDNTKKSLTDEAKSKIKKINELCEKNQCELILLTLPYKSAYNENLNEEISEYSKENNIKFLNMNEENIDWKTCSQDEFGNHLNVYGAEEVGNFLTDYIKKNYSIINHKEDYLYKDWNISNEKYQEYKQKNK